MHIRPKSAQVAIVTGLATTIYYATPDFIDSAAIRTVVKSALAGGVLAVTGVDVRQSEEIQRGALEGLQALRDTFEQVPDKGKVGVIAAGAVAVVGLAATTVMVERWIYQHGKKRAEAGKSLPHTRFAVLVGAVSAVTCLLPMPEREVAGSD
ncbi:hypothetical protein [Ornithinimicrobium sp. INDO-MA30-4]|uniref:hypothetical protein n=1 Tax=Ornithinimicrobium sp. INDO-MA30-4 TaxID=2908651 RepID=UPI001F1C311B|nr:hypothetical protein [Ornithinimicrobium sp. INDO-MA30-4]UJH69576.1 hypothetical protein L0A91_09370 [Ornithinimicrobium sp. INDO-MA30-4]